MRELLAIAAAAMLMIPAPGAAAAKPLRLKPSTKWNVHYGDDSCRLARAFGEGDQQITLVADQFSPDEGFRLIFVGKRLDRRATDGPIAGAIRFGPAEQESEVTAVMGDMQDLPALLVNEVVLLAPPTEAEKAAMKEEDRSGIPYVRPAIGAAREAAATWLHVRMAGVRDFVLETGPMDKALAALRACSWDTVSTWGLDVAQQKALSRKPRPLNQPWLHSSDYPTGMISQGQQAMIYARLMVDETGRPTSCHIQASTRPAAFDKTVCDAFMKRARFEAALDAQGKPVRSYWQTVVHFRIE